MLKRTLTIKHVVCNLNAYLFLMISFFLCFPSISHAYTAGESRCVQVSASIQENPAKITLTWVQLIWKGEYKIYRRTTGLNTSWGEPVATLPHDATEYTDENVEVGVKYEYRIIRGDTGNSYISVGIKLPLRDSHGKIIFLVESSITASLENELNLMTKMMVADGWQVVRAEVSRNDSVVSVKSVIQNLYAQDPVNTKALYLFGNIPVPYSGDIAPDGHTYNPSHKGAWPADVFYGDIDGIWTDSTVYQTAADHDADASRNHNIPGDGKYDQNVAPSAVELQIGRVDLSKLPVMGDEVELLRNYINKDYNYRYKMFDVERRAVSFDGFDGMAGDPGVDVFREAPAFFGQDKITILAYDEFLSYASSNESLWGHVDGGGWWSGANGVGSSAGLKSSDPKVIFYQVWGSWFGDWDSPQDNFLRSFIATDTYGLTSIWAGINHFFAHDMALGDNIGHAVEVFHNNDGSIDKGYSLLGRDMSFIGGSRTPACKTDVALMGDPTLRLHTVYPVTNLQEENYSLSWTPSADTGIVGYHVYRSDSELGAYTRLTTEPVSGNSFVDPSPVADSWYMVRAIKLEVSGSGSYYNASQGIMIQAKGQITEDITPPAAVTDLVTENATASSIQINWTAPGDDDNSGTATSYDLRISTEEITEANFADAVQLENLPIPLVAGTNQNVIVEGLNPETTYYFALKTSDEVPNISLISNIASGTTLQAIDTQAPAVTELTVADIGEETVNLSWIAPGDDGDTGTAANYDLRMSTEEITDANFSGATQVQNIPLPAAAGTVQNITVEGLEVGTTYYFAIKTSDDAANVSALSNVAEAVTLSVSDINPPAAINLLAGTVTAESITMSWVAPGDDGDTGIATSYDLRISTEPITAENFETAQQVENIPLPSIAGTNESVTVTNLLPESTYYFAIKTFDESLNVSEISNTINATTAKVISGDWIALNSSMISYEEGAGNEYIPLARLCDEQDILPANPQDGDIDFNIASAWNPTWGATPVFTIDLGDLHDISEIAILDDWNAASLNVQYWNGSSWKDIFSWDMQYGKQWKIEKVAITTSKLRFEFSELGGTIGEIAIKGTKANLNTPEWLSLDSSMLSYETGTEYISLDTLVDEQDIFTEDPVDGTNNLATNTSWESTWGEIPVFVLDLGASYTISKVAIQDYWGGADMSVEYWDGSEWSALFDWGMYYANAWKVEDVNVSTNKLRFTFAALGAKICEIGIKATPDN